MERLKRTGKLCKVLLAKEKGLLVVFQVCSGLMRAQLTLIK